MGEKEGGCLGTGGHGEKQFLVESRESCPCSFQVAPSRPLHLSIISNPVRIQSAQVEGQKMVCGPQEILCPLMQSSLIIFLLVATE